jgi:hypothetical protein
MATQARIPLPYRIYFQWLDPIISAITAYMALFHKDAVLASFHPLLVPRDTKYDALLWFSAGVFAMIAVNHGLLLRYTDDVRVWKITNLGILMVDLSLLWAMFEMHFVSPEMSAMEIRSEDWMNCFLTLLAVVMRLSFIAEIGVKTEGGKELKNKKRR